MSSAPFLRWLLGGCLFPNMEINHKRGKHEFPKRVGPMQKAVKGSQDDRCPAGLDSPDWKEVSGGRGRLDERKTGQT